MENRILPGCWKDRIINPITGKVEYLLTEYQGIMESNGSYADGCFEKVQSLHVEYFGLKEGGACWTSKPYSEMATIVHPDSQHSCTHGIGGPNHIFLYHIRKLTFDFD